MPAYAPCPGSGQYAVNLEHYQGTPPGLGNSPTPAKTFGECPSCGRTVMQRGYTNYIKVNRHKPKVSDEQPPASQYVADPASPTDEELSAAIQRSLELGTLIDAADWMAEHATELGKDASLI